ncbi:MAG: translation elongation factor Ts [Mesoaciditoga sp.]|uniref:translation elongation factor Ts n=1 Tax=Athalassotoga sp. TaxID=2022597 RepID=UPI000CC5E9FF|nr:MAG: translation elongation factor Ts [Mesoaciditoga sp.]PMP79121.1 MAG: translation elongation factor Ts [Mesoaciditoga sp.]HEU24945.1 translation elongation factor Ts [Mesoaciditoga lauensis]
MEISAIKVKELRDMTGAGMMDCKNALVESGGDMEKAKEILRKKGLSKADKKMGRAANNGWIIDYIHFNGRVGVMLELNCETDFVAKTDEFKALGKEICKHIAMQNPKYISREDVDPATLEKEKEIYRAQYAATGKTGQALEKIVENKLEKFYEENCLMEQKFFLDESKTISDMIKEAIAKLGENISIGRFVRFEIGQG